MATENYDDETYYSIRVTRPAELGPIKYLPRDETRAKGKLVKRLIAKHGEDVLAYADPA